MYAVLATGGKQYRVKPGDIFHVEKLDVEENSEIEFTQILFLSSHSHEKNSAKILKKTKTPQNNENNTASFSQSIHIGKPYVEGAKVKAKVLRQEKANKILVFKKKRRQGYRRTQGHRQRQTQVLVQSIQTPQGEIFTSSKTSSSSSASEKKKKNSPTSTPPSQTLSTTSPSKNKPLSAKKSSSLKARSSSLKTKSPKKSET